MPQQSATSPNDTDRVSHGARSDRVALPAPEQLAFFPEFEYVVPALYSAKIDHRYTKVLNFGVMKLLNFGGGAGPVQNGVANFVAQSLVLMGPKHYHTESDKWWAEVLDVDIRRVAQMKRMAKDLGLLAVVSRGNGRRAWTVPGPLVVMLQTPEMQYDIESRWRSAGIVDAVNRAQTTALQRGGTTALQRGGLGQTTALQRGASERYESHGLFGEPAPPATPVTSAASPPGGESVSADADAAGPSSLRSQPAGTPPGAGGAVDGAPAGSRGCSEDGGGSGAAGSYGRRRKEAAADVAAAPFMRGGHVED